MAPLLRLPALLVLLAATACGPASVPIEDRAVSAPSYPADAPVVQVRRSGGFLPVGAAFRSVPSVSVYGDGRVVVPGAEIAVYPGPALPSVQTGRLPAEQVRALVEDGRSALDGAGDLGQPPVADAPTTVVTVGTGDERVTAAALALDELVSGSASGLTPQQSAARDRLRDVVRQAEQAATEAATAPYEAERLAVLAVPHEGPGSPQDTAEWPGPPLADAPDGCVVVEGAELREVRTAAGPTTQETAWTSAGATWRLAFRPLLPHELTCADATTEPAPASP